MHQEFLSSYYLSCLKFLEEYAFQIERILSEVFTDLS